MSDQGVTVQDLSNAINVLKAADIQIEIDLSTATAMIKSTAITNVPETMRQVKARLALLGLNMKKICKLASIAESAGSRWASGKTSPTLASWERLMATLAELEAKQ